MTTIEEALARVGEIDRISYGTLLKHYIRLEGLDLTRELSFGVEPWRSLARKHGEDGAVILFALFLRYRYRDASDAIVARWCAIARDWPDEALVAVLSVKILLEGALKPAENEAVMEVATSRGDHDWIAIARALAPEPDHRAAGRLTAWAAPRGLSGLIDYLPPFLPSWPSFAQRDIGRELARFGDVMLPHALAFLETKDADTRRAGAHLLVFLRDPSTLPNIERAAKKERKKEVKALLAQAADSLAALDAKPLSAYSATPDAQVALDACLAARASERVDPVDAGQLGLRWSGGALVSEDAARAMLQAFASLDAVPGADDDATILARHLDPVSRGALLDALVASSDDDPAGEGTWIVFAHAVLASPDRFTDVAARFLRRAERGASPAPCVAVLASAPLPAKKRAQLLSWWARRASTAALRLAAWQGLGTIAGELGLDDDEVAELELPPKLAARALAARIERLDRALATERVWSAWRFRILFRDHPSLRAMSRALVFEQLSEDGGSPSFFVLANGDPARLDGSACTIGDTDGVRLAHPLRMDDAARDASRALLAPAKSPIRQLDRPIFRAADASLATMIRESTPLAASTLKSRLSRAGFRHGELDEEHRELIRDHRRRVAEGIDFVIVHSILPVRGRGLRGGEEARVFDAYFARGGDARVPEADIDPVLYSEMALALESLIAPAR